MQTDKILLVDDSLMQRNLQKKILASLNIKPELIMEAGDGKTALKIAKEQDIAIMFLDWNIPLPNGFELLKAFREMEKYKHIPIIMITSEASSYNIKDAIMSGVTDYIVKPFEEKRYIEAITKYYLSKKK
jgi:two-component system chemotaxis response regulator CheY